MSHTSLCLYPICLSTAQVIFHQPYVDETTGLTPLIVTNTGWCLRDNAGVTYLTKVDNPKATQGQGGYYGGCPANMYKAQGSSSKEDGGASTDAEADQEFWYELKDENGDTYYFHSGESRQDHAPTQVIIVDILAEGSQSACALAMHGTSLIHHLFHLHLPSSSGTGVSQWECPPWFDEVDSESGAVYYRHVNPSVHRPLHHPFLPLDGTCILYRLAHHEDSLNDDCMILFLVWWWSRNSATGEAQWEKPEGFVPVIRAEAYSTPEAEFVKSMLSPKRSSRNMMKPGSKTQFDFAAPGVVF